jgi:hypothetical protein
MLTAFGSPKGMDMVEIMARDQRSGYVYTSIGQMRKYQQILVQLDSGNLDSARRLLVDFQDKTLFNLFPQGNLDTAKAAGHGQELLKTTKAIYDYRNSKKPIYYPKGTCLVYANDMVDTMLRRSGR